MSAQLRISAACYIAIAKLAIHNVVANTDTVLVLHIFSPSQYAGI
jgi:hypothetical protein